MGRGRKRLETTGVDAVGCLCWYRWAHWDWSKTADILSLIRKMESLLWKRCIPTETL